MLVGTVLSWWRIQKVVLSNSAVQPASQIWPIEIRAPAGKCRKICDCLTDLGGDGKFSLHVCEEVTVLPFGIVTTSNVPSHNSMHPYPSDRNTHRTPTSVPTKVHQSSTPIRGTHLNSPGNHQDTALLRTCSRLFHPSCTWHIGPSISTTTNCYPTLHHPTTRLRCF